MFLYVTLVLDILVTQVTAEDLRKAVQDLPIGLHRAYDNSLLTHWNLIDMGIGTSESWIGF